MSKGGRRTISVTPYHFERLGKTAERLGVSRGALITAAVDRLDDLPVAGAPPVMSILDVKTPGMPAFDADPDFVDITVSDAVALAVKAIDTTVVAHHSQEREVLIAPAFELAIEAVIARFDMCPPVNRSCAICTVAIDSIANIEERELAATFERRLFLSDRGTYVWICVRCDEQHPRDPKAPRFDGGRNTSETGQVLDLASGGNLAERGRVQARKGRS